MFRSEQMTLSGGSFATGSIEILRDDLSNILMSALADVPEVIYGDRITALKQDKDRVAVSFEKGRSRSFDLVVGADGVGSNIRSRVVGADLDCLHPYDFALAAYSAPNHLALKDWQVSYELGTERCLIYTARDNQELRICFAFAARFADVPADRAGQMALVKQRCGGWRWEAPRLLDAMESSPDFYLGPMAQVRAPRWTSGRVAMVGDAAYCPSPLSGQGTSLALVGAYVLAAELARTPAGHAAAFARYEAKLRPFVAKNQALAELALDPRLADPEYYAGVLEPALEAAQDAIELGADV